jgi:hypothetical protein
MLNALTFWEFNLAWCSFRSKFLLAQIVVEAPCLCIMWFLLSCWVCGHVLACPCLWDGCCGLHTLSFNAFDHVVVTTAIPTATRHGFWSGGRTIPIGGSGRVLLSAGSLHSGSLGIPIGRVLSFLSGAVLSGAGDDTAVAAFSEE